MIMPRTSRPSLNSISLVIMGFWSLVYVGLIGMQPALAEAEAPRTLMSQSGNDAGLAIDLAGFTIDRDRVKSDGRRYIMASHPATGLRVSIALERVPGQASTAGCIARLRQLQKGPFVSRGKDVALSIAHDVQTLEYTLDEFQGVRLNQKSMYACLAEQQVYANIHLSKVQYTAADASLFRSVLTSIHLQPSQLHHVAVQAPGTLTSWQAFPIEGARYPHHDHARSIAP
jgi:hypothetical protein